MDKQHVSLNPQKTGSMAIKKVKFDDFFIISLFEFCRPVFNKKKNNYIKNFFSFRFCHSVFKQCILLWTKQLSALLYYSTTFWNTETSLRKMPIKDRFSLLLPEIWTEPKLFVLPIWRFNLKFTAPPPASRKLKIEYLHW